MFQEKDLEAYQDIKAPAELKNRIRSSIDQQRTRMRKQQMRVLAAAACMALVFSVSGVFNQSSTILMVNDKAVSHRAVAVETSMPQVLKTASEGRSAEPLIQVPMEIRAEKPTHIEVSQGTLQHVVETDAQIESAAEAVTEVEITEPAVIYWSVYGDTKDAPTCTMTTEGNVYTYVIVFDENESVFTIKQTR